MEINAVMPFKVSVFICMHLGLPVRQILKIHVAPRQNVVFGLSAPVLQSVTDSFEPSGTDYFCVLFRF